jgi:hypothetical protein
MINEKSIQLIVLDCALKRQSLQMRNPLFFNHLIIVSHDNGLNQILILMYIGDIVIDELTIVVGQCQNAPINDLFLFKWVILDEMVNNLPELNAISLFFLLKLHVIRLFDVRLFIFLFLDLF